MVEMPKDDVPRGINKTVVAAGVLLLIAAVVGVYFVFQFIASERDREMRAWQIRLGIVADSRAAAINDWIDQQFGTLRELAENASLQLYMTELGLLGDAADPEDSGEAGYLRNLLVATAERAKFSQLQTAPQLSANVERVGLAGIALVDSKGKVLVATPTMPPITGQLRESANRIAKGERGLVDMYLGVSDQPTIGFVQPVFTVQGGRGASDAAGYLLGVKLIDNDLFARLRQPGESEQTAETYLVRIKGPNVEYLSPLKDGTAPLRRVLTLDTPGLDSAYVLQNAGAFGVKVDYASETVLVAGRTLAIAPWTVVRKVATSEALASSESRLTTMLVVFLMMIGVTLVIIIAVWRHGTSVRATAAAERFRVAAERFQNLGKFLRVVTDSQPTEMLAVAEDGRLTFANKTAADSAGVPAEDLLKKTLAAVIGPVRATALQKINKGIIERTEDILAKGERISHVHEFDDERGRHLIRTTHYPLRGDRDHPAAVLMMLDDITDLMRERERREVIFRQLIETLVDLVGQRDPYSANHATRVAEVAVAIANEIELPAEDRRTIEVAAQLMNLGKTLVPSELLTREGKLDDAELQQVRDAILTSARLLERIDFDGPVVEVIRQVQEAADGSGRPKGLSGEQILLPARIVAAANAFVAMASPRSYRKTEIGQWPWPRDEIAKMLVNLMNAGAAAVGFDMVFAEDDRLSPNLIAGRAGARGLEADVVDKLKGLPSNDTVFATILQQSRGVLGQSATSDASRAESGLPKRSPSGSQGARGVRAQDYLRLYPGVVRNIPALETATPGLGMITVEPDNDGIVRRAPALIKVRDAIYPSLTIEMMRVATGPRQPYIINMSPLGIEKVVIARQLQVPTDSKGEIWVYYARPGEETGGLYFPAKDAINNTLPAEAVTGKFVLVGTSAVGLRDIRATPISKNLPGVEVHANIIETVVQQLPLNRPSNIIGAELLFTALVGVLIILFLPMIGAAWTLGFVVVVLGALAGTSWYFFSEDRILVDITYPGVSTLLLYSFLTFTGYSKTAAERRQVRGAFAQYLSPALVEQLAGDPTRLKLGGEMKNMTFLFCDV
ncbi:MAG: CHASE2 domain-containing protein, partial [Alphaproteobacteria bacterium]|nr:CHASE2 domain-containing protein [Alphaproteobacteria bacterium]